MYAFYESPMHSMTQSALTFTSPSSMRMRCSGSLARDPYPKQDEQHLQSTRLLSSRKLSQLLHPLSVSDEKTYTGSNHPASPYQGFEIGPSSVETKVLANTSIPNSGMQSKSTSFLRDAFTDSSHLLLDSSTRHISKASIETDINARSIGPVKASNSYDANARPFRTSNAPLFPSFNDYPRLPSLATINPSNSEKTLRRSHYHRSHSQPSIIERNMHCSERPQCRLNGSNHIVNSYDNRLGSANILPAIKLLLSPRSIMTGDTTKSSTPFLYHVNNLSEKSPDARYHHSSAPETRTLENRDNGHFEQNVEGDTHNVNLPETRVTSRGDNKRRSKSCNVQSCTRNAVTRGLCINHGGGRRCQQAGCSRGAQNQGLCVAHGGGRVCRIKGCTNIQRSMGLCIRHGGGRRCCMPGCGKGVVRQNLCTAHGGKKKCRIEYCPKLVKKKGFCRTHANELDL